MADSRTVIRVRTEGFQRAGARMSQADKRLQRAFRDEFKALGRETEVALYRYAPKDTGAMAESATSSVRSRSSGTLVLDVDVESDARGSGFEYLPVTRYGHRTAVIVPKTAKALAVHRNGRHEEPEYAHSVPGSHPTTDWVDNAHRSMRYRYAQTTRNIGQAFDREVVPSHG
jgi:hypothetical protein